MFGMNYKKEREQIELVLRKLLDKCSIDGPLELPPNLENTPLAALLRGVESRISQPLSSEQSDLTDAATKLVSQHSAQQLESIQILRCALEEISRIGRVASQFRTEAYDSLLARNNPVFRLVEILNHLYEAIEFLNSSDVPLMEAIEKNELERSFVRVKSVLEPLVERVKSVEQAKDREFARRLSFHLSNCDDGEVVFSQTNSIQSLCAEAGNRIARLPATCGKDEIAPIHEFSWLIAEGSRTVVQKLGLDLKVRLVESEHCRKAFIKANTSGVFDLICLTLYVAKDFVSPQGELTIAVVTTDDIVCRPCKINVTIAFDRVINTGRFRKVILNLDESSYLSCALNSLLNALSGEIHINDSGGKYVVDIELDAVCSENAKQLEIRSEAGQDKKPAALVTSWASAFDGLAGIEVFEMANTIPNMDRFRCVLVDVKSDVNRMADVARTLIVSGNSIGIPVFVLAGPSQAMATAWVDNLGFAGLISGDLDHDKIDSAIQEWRLGAASYRAVYEEG